MFLLLSLALFPLGLIAILASVQSARDNSTSRAQQTLARLEIKAQRINALLSRSAGTIRAASAAIQLSPLDSNVCGITLERLARAQTANGRYALYAPDNQVRCATPGYTPPRVANPGKGRSLIEISQDGERLRFALFGEQGTLEGSGEFARASLAQLTLIPGTSGNFDLELLQGERRMLLRDGYEGGPLLQTVTGTAPVAGERLQLRIELSAVPIKPAEVLMILLPVMMWILAALIGWVILDRLLLKPLVGMQRAVAAYRPGDPHLDLPPVSSPAREIGELGQAFNQVTQTVARHEAELEAAIARQRRLVREVHHRVKNNLQVVASLLNLHARGVANEEVAAAYASIQRRVDALAVVHRNHYAELEENRGVALRPLISELGANLRATAPASAAAMAIRIDIEPFYATQDVAVSVAFLITEVVEYAMFCGARSVSISLTGTSRSTAMLALESDSLLGASGCGPELSDRFERIVTGLSRQLRSSLERDGESGRYALAITVVDKAER
ncbi:MAG TPA: sensor histidine kinase [Allosphingosinicella sp.]|nr:sensor histidine kinase [Allosphingosinicella sp.]